MTQYTIEVGPVDQAVLDWVLLDRQKSNPDNAPADTAELLQRAVEGMVLTPWRQEQSRVVIASMQTQINDATPEVQGIALMALGALASATPEQQVAVLTDLASKLGGADGGSVSIPIKGTSTSQT